MGCCKSMVARERVAGYMHGTGTEFCGWAVLAFLFLLGSYIPHYWRVSFERYPPFFS